ELGLSDEQSVGSMVAGVDKVKGHDVLLNALAQRRDAASGQPNPQSTIHKPQSKISLLVLGDGRERPNIEKQIADLGLGPEQVRLLGFRSDVPDILAASDF